MSAHEPGDDVPLARRRVLALGLDGFEISYAEQLMDQGELPALRALRDRSAHVLLDAGPAQRTGLTWEHFWSGRSPESAHRASAVEFDPSTYRVWQEGARFSPFFGSSGIHAVVFDPPYADLTRAASVDGVVAWGAHDPGASPGANPTGLHEEFLRRVGAYPGKGWVYGTPWPSVDATREMATRMVEAVDRRADGARWLLTERFDGWDLGIVVVGELHGAAEGLWHGVDPAHPLHDHPSAPVAAAGLAGIYRAVDRLVGELLEATAPEVAFVFSLGGMGTNHSDIASMALLPELLLRWSLGERLLEVAAEWAADPSALPWPEPGSGPAEFRRAWYPRLERPDDPSPARAVARRLPEPVRRSLRRAVDGMRTARGARTGNGSTGAVERPAGYQELRWQPAAWYQPWWSRMRAFALPSFYDGRIRLNLSGRERDGMVDLADYDRVCDEVEELIRACRDPRTGEGVVKRVERPASGADPCALDSSEADLVVEWNACTSAFDHPVHGLVGPLPLRRTGGHTGPYGFAFVEGEDFEAGDHGVASAFDVAATIAHLLNSGRVEGMSGTPLRLQSVR